MPLLRDGIVSENIYTDVSATESLPNEGALLISLEQWHEHRNALTGRNDPLGIILRSDEKPEVIATDLHEFDVVALDFPAFGDGRAYSYARLLRDRYNYTGELRAIGDVLLEQLHFMHRVGFNAFDVADDNAIQAWKTAAADIHVWYQPTGDGRTSVLELRHQQN
jgi:uncharacterized protein (DUF934 family)